jgi:hypothetical protein
MDAFGIVIKALCIDTGWLTKVESLHLEIFAKKLKMNEITRDEQCWIQLSEQYSRSK